MKITISGIMLTLLLICMLTSAISIVTADYVLVPNGSFESGTVGLVPDDWVMVTKNLGPEAATWVHEMKQTDQKYFEGSRSLWMHSRVVDTDGTRASRDCLTIAETEDWINAPTATHVRIYIRDIISTHSALHWGWGNGIFLWINNVSVAVPPGPYAPWLFTHGEFINWNYYNYTAAGSDGGNWYVYEYSIPVSVDKTHMKIQIVCSAGDWTFYSTSYFSDLEFVVDKVELLTAPPVHDVAVVGVNPESDWLYQGKLCHANINVTVTNEGDAHENFTVTLYYNITSGDTIGTQPVTNLLPSENRTLTFLWDTRDVTPCRNYTMTAVASIVPNETDTADNIRSSPFPVRVRILGDVNDDRKVDGRDIAVVALAFASYPTHPRWNPQADLNNDNKTDGKDIAIVAKNFGKSCP